MVISSTPPSSQNPLIPLKETLKHRALHVGYRFGRYTSQIILTKNKSGLGTFFQVFMRLHQITRTEKVDGLTFNLILTFQVLTGLNGTYRARLLTRRASFSSCAPEAVYMNLLSSSHIEPTNSTSYCVGNCAPSRVLRYRSRVLRCPEVEYCDARLQGIGQASAISNRAQLNPWLWGLAHPLRHLPTN